MQYYMNTRGRIKQRCRTSWLIAIRPHAETLRTGQASSDRPRSEELDRLAQASQTHVAQYHSPRYCAVGQFKDNQLTQQLRYLTCVLCKKAQILCDNKIHPCRLFTLHPLPFVRSSMCQPSLEALSHCGQSPCCPRINASARSSLSVMFYAHSPLAIEHCDALMEATHHNGLMPFSSELPVDHKGADALRRAAVMT